MLCSPKVAARTWRYMCTVHRMHAQHIPHLGGLGYVPDRGRIERGIDALGGRDNLSCLIEVTGPGPVPLEWYRAIDARIPAHRTPEDVA